MPEEGIQNLTLDGVPLNPFYKPVPLTSYMYAQIELPPGSHTLRSSLRFGANVYGYGPYTSYGYPAGMVFRPEPGLGVPAESAEGLITATALSDDRAVIEFSSPSAGRVSIDLYGIDGRLARRIAAARDIEPGHNRIEFSRSRLARGIYFCRVTGLRGGMSVARLLVE